MINVIYFADMQELTFFIYLWIASKNFDESEGINHQFKLIVVQSPQTYTVRQ